MVRIATGAKKSGPLLIEPDILIAPAVVDAIYHNGQSLHPRLPARSAARVKDHRPGTVLGQPLFDFPDQFFALVLVWLHRLPIDQLVDLGAAIAGIVALRTARVVFIELLVGIVDTRFRDAEADCKI